MTNRAVVIPKRELFVDIHLVVRADLHAHTIAAILSPPLYI